MSAIRCYAVAAAVAGVMSLAACATTSASQPGAASAPSPATSTPAPATTTPAPATATPSDPGTPKMSQQPVLRLGSRGSAVTVLQQRLIALHYFDVAAADGVFEEDTYHAVIAFQKVQDLTRDGVGRRRPPGPSWPARTSRHPATRWPPCRWRSTWPSRSSTTSRAARSSASSMPRPAAAPGTTPRAGGPGRSPRPVGPHLLALLQRLAARAAGLDVPPELLLRRLRRARHDLRAGLPGQPRLRPDDRPDDGPHVVLTAGGHAGRDLQFLRGLCRMIADGRVHDGDVRL